MLPWVSLRAWEGELFRLGRACRRRSILVLVGRSGTGGCPSQRLVGDGARTTGRIIGRYGSERYVREGVDTVGDGDETITWRR